MTLNKYSVQVRGLPDLDIKHQIEAGNDLTCFVRMVSRLNVSSRKLGWFVRGDQLIEKLPSVMMLSLLQGCSFLTGHETGRLNLYRLNPNQG
jgi:hypothetical protein